MPRPVSTRPSSVAVAVAVAVATVIAAWGPLAPAHADSTTKSDPRGDAVARLDISSVTYRNTTAQVTARIRVPELIRSGRAEFAAASPGGTDVAYVAIASIKPDGTLRKRFVERGNEGDTAKRCDFRAQWNATKNYVYFAVPRACVENAGKANLYLRTDMSAFGSDDRDFGPAAAHLARD